jgi:hypothetical protein
LLKTVELSALQAAFLGDVTGAKPRTAADRATIFAAPPGDSVEVRWSIYGGGYVARLAEAIENDFPATRRILGPSAFESLVARYVRRFPPCAFDIGSAGDRLADFLAADPLAADLRFLPDLASLEWRLAEAFVAEDAQPLAWSALGSLDPEIVADTTFHLLPGSALIETRWPLLALRSAQSLADGEVSIPMDERLRILLVHRVGLEVRSREVGAEDAAFLELAAGGLCLGVAAGDSEERALDLVARFRFWVAEGLFIKQGIAHFAPTPAH